MPMRVGHQLAHAEPGVVHEGCVAADLEKGGDEVPGEPGCVCGAGHGQSVTLAAVAVGVVGLVGGMSGLPTRDGEGCAQLAMRGNGRRSGCTSVLLTGDAMLQVP